MAVHQNKLDVANMGSGKSSRADNNGGIGMISDDLLDKLITERESFDGLGNAALRYENEDDLIVEIKKKTQS
jgi:hypothetical protein